MIIRISTLRSQNVDPLRILACNSKDGRIILRWIFRKWDGVWTRFSWLRIETGGGHL
jgi:hypothetical protein